MLPVLLDKDRRPLAQASDPLAVEAPSAKAVKVLERKAPARERSALVPLLGNLVPPSSPQPEALASVAPANSALEHLSA